MKSGMTLTEMAAKLMDIKKNARDFVVPTRDLTMNPDGKLHFGNDIDGGLNNWSGNQLATYTDIPRSYFDRLQEERPDLLARNVNHGLARIAENSEKNRKPESRLIRTYQGQVRGFLSSRYRRLDSFDMLESVLPVMVDHGFEVQSSDITEKRLFIKAITPRVQAEIKKGDVVQYGIVISNSDVGASSVRVEPLIYRLVCSNGMIANTAMLKYHIGKNEASESIEELLSDNTKALEDGAFWAKVKDVVLNSMRSDVFNREVDKLRVAATDEIKNFDLPRVVELTMKATGVTGEATSNSILAALASGNEGAGLTRWGLINSFTRAAQSEHVDYEQATELERAAGSILELPRNQWELIAAKAG